MMCYDAILAVGLVIQTVAVPPSRAAQAPVTQVQAPVHRGDQLTKKQLLTLPDTAVIEVQGRRMTVGQIKTRAAQRHTELEAKSRAWALQAQSRFAARRAQSVQRQQATWAANRIKANAEVARLRQVAAIQAEAAQLFHRSSRAAAGERAQIDQRAAQLVQQLRQLRR